MNGNHQNSSNAGYKQYFFNKTMNIGYNIKNGDFMKYKWDNTRNWRLTD